MYWYALRFVLCNVFPEVHHHIRHQSPTKLPTVFISWLIMYHTSRGSQVITWPNVNKLNCLPSDAAVISIFINCIIQIHGMCN